MAWPSPTEFNEAVQSPPTAFADTELRRTQAATDPLGLVRPFAGSFADVYQLEGPDGHCWAVKCFTRAVPHLQERYQAISDHLQQGVPSFMVPFRYLAEGVRIQGQWYPVVKMPWIQGLMLNQFVRDNLDRPVLLDRLARMWLKLAQQLRGVGAAHADLQHGNVLLVPNAKTGGLSLRLIDYDGMFVPALAHSPSGEVGHPNYQHPQRLRESTYNAEIDRFAHLVIYTALRCLALPGGRPLWERFDNGDNLLFREQDFQAPQQSVLFRELWRTQPAPTRTLAGHLLLAAQGPLTQVPLLDELVSDGLTEALTAEQAQRVRRLLGDATPDTAAAILVTPAMFIDPVVGVLVSADSTRPLRPGPAAPPPLAIPVTPARLLEPAPGVLVSAESTQALRPVPAANAKSKTAIPVAHRAGPPPLPRAVPVGQPAIDWQASLGGGAVVVGIILLGLLLMVLVSAVVLSTLPPTSNHPTPDGPPKFQPPAPNHGPQKRTVEWGNLTGRPRNEEAALPRHDGQLKWAGGV